jgi:hypothetical protein
MTTVAKECYGPKPRLFQRRYLRRTIYDIRGTVYFFFSKKMMLLIYTYTQTFTFASRLFLILSVTRHRIITYVCLI